MGNNPSTARNCGTGSPANSGKATSSRTPVAEMRSSLIGALNLAASFVIFAQGAVSTPTRKKRAGDVPALVRVVMVVVLVAPKIFVRTVCHVVKLVEACAR